MKRLILIFLIAALLCGCGVGQELPANTSPAAAPTETQEGEGLETVAPQEQPETALPVEPVPVVPGEVSYSILEHDDSVRNENGDVLVSIRYQQVLLDNSLPQWEAVNALIQESYQAFREETAYLRDTPPEQWEQMLQDMGAVYGNFMANCTARVTHNAGGVLSIRMHRDWFMGGVFNADPFALNFDLTTGEKLSLARLSDLPEEEFAEQLKQIVCDYLAQDIDLLFEDPAVVLETYSLEDFSYCIEEGELVLLFSTYTFGPGAMGSTVIRTGIYPQL